MTFEYKVNKVMSGVYPKRRVELCDPRAAICPSPTQKDLITLVERRDGDGAARQQLQQEPLVNKLSVV
jgi:hypothetical protein